MGTLGELGETESSVQDIDLCVFRYSPVKVVIFIRSGWELFDPSLRTTDGRNMFEYLAPYRCLKTVEKSA